MMFNVVRVMVIFGADNNVCEDDLMKIWWENLDVKMLVCQ